VFNLQKIVADLSGILHLRPQNTSVKIWGRLNCSGLNLENNAVLIEEDPWYQRTEAVDDWHVGLTLAPANSQSPVMALMSASSCLHLRWTFLAFALSLRLFIRLVYGISYKRYCHLLTRRSRLLHKLHEICNQIIFPTFLRYLHSVLHILYKSKSSL